MTTTMEEVERLVKKFVRLVAQEEENGWTDEEDALTKSQFEQYMEEYRGFFEVPLKLKECAVAGGADAALEGQEMFGALFEQVESGLVGNDDGAITKEGFKQYFLATRLDVFTAAAEKDLEGSKGSKSSKGSRGGGRGRGG